MKYKKIKLFIILSLLFSNGCQSSLLFVGTSRIPSENEKPILNGIKGIDIDKDGNLYVADSFNNAIKKITPEGIVLTFAGNGKQGDKDGLKEEAELNHPTDIKIDSNNDIYIADTNNKKIKVIHNEIIKTLDIKNFNLNIDKYTQISLFFSSNNQLHLFDGDHLILSKDLKSYINQDLDYSKIYGTYKRDVFMDRATDNIYIIAFEPVGGGGLDKYNNYLNVVKNGTYENITIKYNKKPYPESNIVNLTFDDAQNMYIFYEGGLISKTSKEDKYIKTYWAIDYYLPLSFLPIGSETHSYIHMVIDNKRKILYFTDPFAIYKVNID